VRDDDSVGRTYQRIGPTVAAWLGGQQMFFVATAPSDGEGRINVSPKGLDTFRVIGPHDVRYLDLTGSGVETIAHLRDNGRITFMFCAFEGPPRIVRLFGTGTVTQLGEPGFAELAADFPPLRGARAVISVHVDAVSDSCGFAVPRFSFVTQRSQLAEWTDGRSDQELAEYRAEKNTTSIDGLPGFTSG
jgi:Pyridoxamine 5'-phosphate oxidase